LLLHSCKKNRMKIDRLGAEGVNWRLQRMNHKDRFAGRELNWTGSGQGRMDGLLGGRNDPTDPWLTIPWKSTTTTQFREHAECHIIQRWLKDLHWR
jgi:hypothetical protein